MLEKNNNVKNYPVVFPPSRGKMLMVLAGGIVFVSFGISKISDGVFHSELDFYILATATLFFGLGSLIIAWQIIFPIIWLEVHENGFRYGKRGKLFIPWSEVVSVDEYKIYTRGISQKFVRVDVYDLEKFKTPKTVFGRLVSKLDRQLNFEFFLINSTHLKGSFNEIFSAMNEAYENYKNMKPGE